MGASSTSPIELAAWAAGPGGSGPGGTGSAPAGWGSVPRGASGAGARGWEPTLLLPQVEVSKEGEKLPPCKMEYRGADGVAPGFGFHFSSCKVKT